MYAQKDDTIVFYIEDNYLLANTYDSNGRNIAETIHAPRNRHVCVLLSNHDALEILFRCPVESPQAAQHFPSFLALWLCVHKLWKRLFVLLVL